MYAATLILTLTLFTRSSFAADDIIISACESEIINIGCKHGQVLNIQKAIYCYHDTNACCSSDYTSHIIIGLCQNNPNCHFQVSRYLFADFCYKYENNLTIYYTCIDSIPNPSTNKCKKFEEWSSTASTCPKMCPSKYEQPEDCPTKEGCKCIKNYVIDRRTMTCIPEKYCPISDEENERFSRCHAESQRYCPGPIIYEKEISKECIPGYVCDKCLYRDLSGHCIPFEQCPQLRG